MQAYLWFHGLQDEETFIAEEKEDPVKTTVDEIKQEIKRTKYQCVLRISFQIKL